MTDEQSNGEISLVCCPIKVEYIVEEVSIGMARLQSNRPQKSTTVRLRSSSRWHISVFDAVLLVLLIVLAFSRPLLAADRTITAYHLYDKVHGMWLGQLIGNAAGRPTEGKYSGPNPNPNSTVDWQIKQIWDADDDTDIEYIALHVLETYGPDCNSYEIAQQWLTHINGSGIYIANRQAWYLLRDGLLPPDTGSRSYNQHWYSIDAQICTETLGAVCPGLPQVATELACKFAHVTNTGFPIHAAQFYAAMYADAFFEPNIIALIQHGLQAVPKTSRTHQVIEDVFNWYIEDVNDGLLDWRATREKLYDKYQGSASFGRYYDWVESTINTGSTVLALLYGQGAFKNTIQIAVLAGWDSDCNPATAGGLLGIIYGFRGLPPDLTDPRICGDTYENVYRPYLPDPNLYLPQYDTITAVSRRLLALAEQNIILHGGYSSGNGPARLYYIPENDTTTGEPEKPDPQGPAGLVGQALAAQIAVVPTAAVQHYDSANDRNNLYSIIDGITDNSYNGRKPYYSYVADPEVRPARDWYQLNFSKPVRFDQLTFYQGDVLWNHINDYYKNDDAQGGFFENLTVEILRDGKYIQPAELQMSPALDRYEMYQTITFTFAPTVGNAIRIIGTPGAVQGFTTILELEAQGDIDPGLYVSAVQIADGQPQRSRVGSIEIEFSRVVTITKNDVEIIGAKDRKPLEPNTIDLSYNDLAARLTLPSSLPDDVYELRLNCNSIIDIATGWPLLDDDQNPHDGFYTIKFLKLFGDADGSGTVDFSDLALLTMHWLGNPDGTGLDSNADDTLNFIDLSALAQNWLTHL